MKRLCAAAVALAPVAASLAFAPHASADVACDRVGFSGLFLKVTIDEKETFLDFRVNGGEIEVAQIVGPGPYEPIDCTDGGNVAPPTNTTTDEVRIRDLSGGRSSINMNNPEAFAPGATDAGGDIGPAFPNEIEFDIDLGPGGGDRLNLYGDDTANSYRLGRAGINPNVEGSAPDADIFAKGAERYVIGVAEGDDEVDASGSAETGKALARPLSVDGEGGDDAIVGGAARDDLEGDEGEDTLEGRGGNDVLDGGVNADLISGNAGRDRAVYFRGGLSEILSISPGSGANDGGISDGPVGFRDSLAASVEDVTATSGGPIALSGTDAANRLEVIGTAGGTGSLFGSGGADVLLGGAGDELLDGGSGKDRMIGGAGSDQLSAKDNTRDKRIDCGPGQGEQATRDDIDPPPISC